jgi:hypothetical protein
MSETRGEGVKAAVLAFLSGLELQGADVARGEVALALAAALDGIAPAYALAGLSSELRSILAELDEDGGDADVLEPLRRRAEVKMMGSSPAFRG